MTPTVNHGGERWAFRYETMAAEDAEAPIFWFDRHSFVTGEYVSIIDHEGVQRTFRVVSLSPCRLPCLVAPGGPSERPSSIEAVWT
jgi:hypothetical protein